jgi:hypothetical protein
LFEQPPVIQQIISSISIAVAAIASLNAFFLPKTYSLLNGLEYADYVSLETYRLSPESSSKAVIYSRQAFSNCRDASAVSALCIDQIGYWQRLLMELPSISPSVISSVNTSIKSQKSQTGMHKPKTELRPFTSELVPYIRSGVDSSAVDALARPGVSQATIVAHLATESHID